MAWDMKPLGSVAELQRGFDLPSTQRVDGPYPIVSSAGVTGQHSVSMAKGPGVVTGRCGSIGKVFYVPGDFWPLNTTLWVKSFHGNDIKFVYHLLQSFDFDKFSDKTGVPGVNRNDLHQVLVPVPPLDVQRRIAAALDVWDAAIETAEQLAAAFARRMDYLRELRMHGTDASRRTRLASVTRESVLRNGTSLARDAVMAVTRQVGMRPMKLEAMAANIERYKIVRPRAFAYNPMRLNIGSIAMSRFDADVLVSPDYVVFECDETQLLPGYLNHLRQSRHWVDHFGSAGNGGVRVRIYFNDLGAYSIRLPGLAEQQRTIEVLDAASHEIDALTRYAAALKSQKLGLMQKLLGGEWRLDSGLDPHTGLREAAE